MAILLLLVVLGITVVSRKITHGLEFANLSSTGLQLIFLMIVDLFIVPFSVWWDALRGLPPEGSDATLLGGLAGVTALASGLNWYVMNHYQGQGLRHGPPGRLPGRDARRAPRGAGGRPDLPDDEKNAALWKRWMGFLKLDMWWCSSVGR